MINIVDKFNFLANLKLTTAPVNAGVRYILDYIRTNKALLNNVKFIEKGAKYCPRSLYIVMKDAQTNNNTTFYYKYEKGITKSPEIAFQNIRMNYETLYVQIVFSECNELEYLNVLEENPYYDSGEYREEVNQLIEHLMISSRKQELMQQIDEALINGDKELFMILSERYAELTGRGTLSLQS